jgi:hypothetical protein
MLVKKLRAIAVGLIVATVSLGLLGLVPWTMMTPVTAQAAPADKPLTELEALRKENELLKVNLHVLLEKVKAQEAELRALRGTKPDPEQPKAPTKPPPPPSVSPPLDFNKGGGGDPRFKDGTDSKPASSPFGSPTTPEPAHS